MNRGGKENDRALFRGFTREDGGLLSARGELTQEAVAERFLVSESCFKRVWKRYRESGNAAPGQMGRAEGG
ncbi:hypothetical protein HW44_00090 [Nitrosococcus oceani]|nr:hypothetical protein HW44_00090 [Nitrosococcus oceani]